MIIRSRTILLFVLLAFHFIFIKCVTSQVPVKTNIIKNEGQVTTSLNSAFDLTILLPKNHVTDGSVNYTTILQQGLDKYSDVKFPNFPILIDSSGLKVKSGPNLFFQDKSTLLLKPNSAANYSMISIVSVSSINIYNAKIVGDRFHHVGNTVGVGSRCCSYKF